MLSHNNKKFTNLRHLWESMYQPKMVMCRSSRPEEFCKKGVLRGFVKFTQKEMCQSLFFDKITSQQPATLLAKYLYLPFPCFITPSWLSSQFGVFFKHEEKKQVCVDLSVSIYFQFIYFLFFVYFLYVVYLKKENKIIYKKKYFGTATFCNSYKMFKNLLFKLDLRAIASKRNVTFSELFTIILTNHKKLLTVMKTLRYIFVVHFEEHLLQRTPFSSCF